MNDFTWRGRFTEVVETIPDEQARKDLVYTLVMYGSAGLPIDLPWPLGSIAMACTNDIDFSVSAYKSGSRGGKKRSKDSDADPSDNPCEGAYASTLDKGGSQGPKASQSKVKQSKVNQGKVKQEGVNAPAPAFEPPTVNEVVSYAKCQTLDVPGCGAEAGKFVNHFAAQGWVRSNGQPVRDWRPLWAKWVSERSSFARGQPDRDAAEAHARELGRRYGEAGRTEEVG